MLLCFRYRTGLFSFFLISTTFWRYFVWSLRIHRWLLLLLLTFPLDKDWLEVVEVLVDWLLFALQTCFGQGFRNEIILIVFCLHFRTFSRFCLENLWTNGFLELILSGTSVLFDSLLSVWLQTLTTILERSLAGLLRKSMLWWNNYPSLVVAFALDPWKYIFRRFKASFVLADLQTAINGSQYLFGDTCYQLMMFHLGPFHLPYLSRVVHQSVRWLHINVKDLFVFIFFRFCTQNVSRLSTF